MELGGDLLINALFGFECRLYRRLEALFNLIIAKQNLRHVCLLFFLCKCIICKLCVNLKHVTFYLFGI